jgi:hypothetical protein
MNYNKHLEELQKFRDEIRDIQTNVEGLGVEVGNYIDEFEKIRDDAERRKIDPSFFDRDGGLGKKKKIDSVKSSIDGEHLTNNRNDLDESIKKRMKKIAGIL